MKTGIPQIDLSIERWYELKDVPEQLRLINEEKRFKVAPAGRRSGKTERAKRVLVKEANANPGGLYFAAAPVHDQAKKIWWRDLKRLSFSGVHKRRPSETERIIFFDNGSELHVFGLDKPERMEGIPWAGGVIDEIGSTKEDAWEVNVRPALDTFHPDDPDYLAWCWLIGVPEGMNHYYDLAEYAKTSGDPDWGYYHWKSSEVLPEAVIEAAKRQLSPKQFRQEYEASFETASGKIYEDYGYENVCSEELQSHEQIKWCHDFNFTPLSSAICVERNGCYYVVDEIVLTSAISRQSALEFVERYREHANKNVIIYGDPSGRIGEKHGHKSDYIEMENVLKEAGWKFTRKVRSKAPAIKDRQNALRAFICNANMERRFFVNPKSAPYCHKGLSTVQLKNNSSFLEEDSNYQHITTALGYMVEHDYPVGRGVIGISVQRDIESELNYSV